MKSGEAMNVLCAQFSQMIWPCKCFPREKSANPHTQPGEQLYEKSRYNIEYYNTIFNLRDTEVVFSRY